MISNIYIIFLISGMLIFSALPSMLGFNSQVSFNDVYRYLVVFTSLLSILSYFFKSSVLSIPKKYFVLFLFLFIYFLRLVYDLYMYDITLYFDDATNSYKTDVYYILLYLVIVIFPVLGILSIDSSKIDFNFILNSIYYIIFFILMYSLFYRTIYGYQIRSSGILKLDVITYGHYGATLMILSFYKIFISEKLRLFRIVYLIGIISGLIVIFVSGSRSPLLAVGFAMIFFYHRKLNILKSTLIFSFSFLFLYIFSFDILFFINDLFPNTLVERIMYGFRNIDSIGGRNMFLSIGIEEFMESPIIGKSFLITKPHFEGAYPHNLIIESFMALGIIGGTIFTVINFNILRYVDKIIISENFEWVGLLFLQFFIFGMFSGNIFSSTLYWIFLGLVIANKQSNSNDYKKGQNI